MFCQYIGTKLKLFAQRKESGIAEIMQTRRSAEVSEPFVCLLEVLLVFAGGSRIVIREQLARRQVSILNLKAGSRSYDDVACSTFSEVRSEEVPATVSTASKLRNRNNALGHEAGSERRSRRCHVLIFFSMKFDSRAYRA